MAVKPAPSRLNPTLFDKLVADSALSGLRGEEVDKLEASREAMRYYSVPRLERFNEGALRATVRRELAWLLNTTNLGAVVDLADFPEVQTSVLNYGVPDMTGKSLHRKFVIQRARDIRMPVPHQADHPGPAHPAERINRMPSQRLPIHRLNTFRILSEPRPLPCRQNHQNRRVIAGFPKPSHSLGI